MDLRSIKNAILQVINGGISWRMLPRNPTARRVVLFHRLIASICAASASSIRATGSHNWIVLITTLTAAATLGKEQTADEIADGSHRAGPLPQ